MTHYGKCVECGRVIALGPDQKVLRHGFRSHKSLVREAYQCSGAGHPPCAQTTVYVQPGRVPGREASDAR